MAGRRPKPTIVKKLEGNPGCRPLPKNEPKPKQVAGLPPCPKHLKGLARRCWTRVGTQVVKMRVMTEADVDALEVLCLTYQEYREAFAVIETQGQTYMVPRYRDDGSVFEEPKIRPEARIVSDAGKRLRMLYVEFGLTPSSRARVQVTPDEDSKGFAAFVAERAG